MSELLKDIIEKELRENEIFNVIFKDFEIPELHELEKHLNLSYESNEYMGYYKKDIYFDLVPKADSKKTRGTLKLTFVSSTKDFDIQKAMHLTPTSETYIVSTTFRVYDGEEGWDAVRYSYTLWKNKK